MQTIHVPKLVIVPVIEEFIGIKGALQRVDFEKFESEGIVYFFKVIPIEMLIDNTVEDDDLTSIYTIEDATLFIDDNNNITLDLEE